MEELKMVIEINESDFDEKISGKCLVSFSTTWCGPCKMLTPVMEELSEEMKDVSFYKVDADVSVELGVDFDIVTVPTLIMFEDGQAVRRASGFMSKDKLQEFVEG